MPTTYNQLLADCITTAEDTTTEFLAYFPRALDVAEERLYRLLDLDFSTEATISSTLGGVTLAKPANHRVTHNLYLVNSGERLRLVKKTKSFLRDYWPSLTENDVPKYYAEDDDLYYLSPTPNAVYSLLCEFEAKPTALSVLNQTNVLTDKYSDLLFYATMSNLAEFMKDEARQATYEAKLTEGLSTADNEGRRLRMDDNTNVNQSGRNTKTKNGT